jgi:TRAP-type C4-dicarboxylate transport system substrate-binding protein
MGGNHMRLSTSIKALAVGLALSLPGTAFAQDTVELIYSDTVPETDIRTTVLRESFGQCLGDGFSFESFHGATLFAQGTELTAMQRGNLDLGSLAVFDFYNQVPETSLLGVAYLYKDYDHMRAIWASGVLEGLLAQVEEQAGVNDAGRSGWRQAAHAGR